MLTAPKNLRVCSRLSTFNNTNLPGGSVVIMIPQPALILTVLTTVYSIIII